MRKFIDWIWTRPRIRSKIQGHQWRLDNINDLHLPTYRKWYLNAVKSRDKYMGRLGSDNLHQHLIDDVEHCLKLINDMERQKKEHEQAIAELERKLESFQ